MAKKRHYKQHTFACRRCGAAYKIYHNRAGFCPPCRVIVKAEYRTKKNAAMMKKRKVARQQRKIEAVMTDAECEKYEMKRPFTEEELAAADLICDTVREWLEGRYEFAPPPKLRPEKPDNS